MLDHRDQAFLRAAVQSGVLPAVRAQELASRYQGAAGGLADALVQTRAITPTTRDQLWTQVVSGSAQFSTRADPGSGARPPFAASGSSRADTREYSSKSGSASGRSGILPGGHRVPAIPGFKVEEELGRGGMGAVYRGVREGTGEEVAIKVLHSASEKHVARFEREAQALERLKHPNVVQLLASGKVDGEPYLVMAFVRGGDFKDALEAESIPLDRALALMAKVARTLGHAHNLGILHRDLKPANILIDERGEPRVTDFGLAKILDRETQLTQTNAAIGTPQYMAPEQVRGSEFSEAIDAYAIGVILYQIVTGELPFSGETSLALFRAIQEDLPPRPWKVADIPRELGQLILWALEKDASERPTCMELAVGLEDFLAGSRIEVLPPSMRRQRLKWALAAVGLVLLIVAGGVIAQRVAESRREAAVEQAALETVESVKAALSEARRARKGRELANLLKEAEAYRKVAAALKTVPPGKLDEAQDLLAKGKAGERRLQVLALAVPLLSEAGRPAEAETLAREHAALAPGRTSELLLARALAGRAEGAQEAFRLVKGLLAQREELDEATLGELARTLLSLRRPALAADALEGAPPGLLGLRGLARERAGHLASAHRDLRTALKAGTDLELAVALARVEGRLGKHARALKALEKVKGGADQHWQTARAGLLEALGRPGAARAAHGHALAIATASKAKPRILQARTARARFHLRRGRRLQAEQDLRGVEQPGAQLDRALSRWLGGASHEQVFPVLEQVVAGVEALRSSRAEGAAAARWLARLWIAKGGPPQNALVWARKAWALSPTRQSARTLAWANLRAGDAKAAGAALDQAKDPGAEAAWLRAWIHVEEGAPAKAKELLTELPALRRLQLELRLAKPGDAKRAALANRLYRRWQRGAPVAPSRPKPVPVPVASRESEDPLARLTERLYHEARASYARLGSRESEGRRRALLLLRRTVALAPDHLAARLDLARALEDVTPATRVIDEYPRLADARRARLQVRNQRLRSGKGRPSQAELTTDFVALSQASDITVRERYECAQAFLKGRQDAQRAWNVLAPALALATRDRRVYQLGVHLARVLNKDARKKQLAKALQEIEETYAKASELARIAFVGERNDNLNTARPALRRIARDLPRTPIYWRLKAQLNFGEGAWVLAMLAGGEWMVVERGMSASGPTMWLYGFGWTEQAPRKLLLQLAEQEIEKAPGKAGPFLTQAMFFGARYYRKVKKDAEDIERAADLALRGVHLSPESPGTLALAANLLLTAGDMAEAEDLTGRALARDPRSQFGVMQQVRAAAIRKQAGHAIRLLSGLRFSSSLRIQLKQDPTFEAIAKNADWITFLESKGIK